MTPEEVRQLFELARRLDSTPRRVLTAAAQAIDNGSGPQSALHVLRNSDLQRGKRAEDCARLLLTPVSDMPGTLDRPSTPLAGRHKASCNAWHGDIVAWNHWPQTRAAD